MRGGLRHASEDRPLAFTPKKRKTLEAAQKYAQKGSYDKALVEYEKLLKADPKDSNLRLKIGDLHLKKGDKAKAIQTYTDVADMFSRGGFDAKAVAIYKQILRVEEDALEARTRLGECFQRMGLTSDALREFQDAFKICQKRELKREAFELLRRVASLDPGNVANRLNLAGLFAREGMQDDAKREFTSLLEEVRRQTGADLVVRVAEQMLHAFPENREAVDALVWAKLSGGTPAEAIALLKPLIAKSPDDIALRESLVTAYESAGDTAAVKKMWREIADLYKRRGDVDKSRDIMQRHAAVEEFSASDENTTPSILLTDSTGAMPDGNVLELDATGSPSARHVTTRPATRPTAVVEKGRATPPPVRPPLSSQKRAPSAAPAPVRGSSADLLAEARVSLEFGDPEEAARLARKVLETEPDSEDAHALLAEAGHAPVAAADDSLPGLIERNEPEESIEFAVESVPAPTFDVQLSKPEIAALSPGEDFDTLPDIEIVLEDEEDRDEHFASIDPPLELELGPDPTPFAAPVARAKPTRAAVPADSFDIEIEVEGESDGELSLDFSKSLTVPKSGESFGDASLRIAESLTEADFYLEQGLVDEAERIYTGVLEQVPNHPKAMLRLGEIAVRRAQKPAAKPAAAKRVVESAQLEEEFGDTMVREPDGSEALSLPEIAAAVESLDYEPSVVGEDTIPPLELEAAPPDELVFAEDTDSPLDFDLDLANDPALALEPELERDLEPVEDFELEADPEPALDSDDEDTSADDEFDETSHSSDEEGEFDLAAMLDDEEGDSSSSLGTLIGVGAVGRGFAEVFSAFKKGIQEQVEEGDADTHYDLAIAYKEMGLNEDAVRELEAVLRTGTRAIEALSLLAHCKLALGDPAAAASHLEDALQRAGDSDDSAVSLRYDLGEALLAGGREAEALEAFKKVAAADPKFRDVVERISRFG